MNVVYSSSDSYSPVTGTSMYSLLVNNKDSEELNVFLVDNGMTEENKEKFRRMCSDFGRTLTIIPLADLEKLTGAFVDSGRWNISTYGRLFHGSMLPENVDKVIHIDCDTIITSSLEDLWNTDITDKVVAGARDCIGDSYKTELGLSKDSIYMNVGVLVLNLKKIRQEKIEDRFIKFIQERSRFFFADQGVFNACITDQEKKIIPISYNAYSILYYFKYKNAKLSKRAKEYYTEEEVKQAINNPVIIHYTTCFMDGSRPWIENNSHPTLEKYLEYRSLSPWSDEPLWKDERNVAKKLMHKMFRVLPQGMVAFVIGIIHGVLLPGVQKLKK